MINRQIDCLSLFGGMSFYMDELVVLGGFG